MSANVGLALCPDAARLGTLRSHTRAYESALAAYGPGHMPPLEAAMPGPAMVGMVKATVTRDGETTTIRRFHLSSTAMEAARSPPR